MDATRFTVRAIQSWVWIRHAIAQMTSTRRNSPMPSSIVAERTERRSGARFWFRRPDEETLSNYRVYETRES